MYHDVLKLIQANYWVATGQAKSGQVSFIWKNYKKSG